MGVLFSKVFGMRAEKRRYVGGREGDLRVLGLMVVKLVLFGSYSFRWGFLVAFRGSACFMMGEEISFYVFVLFFTGVFVF